MQTGYADTVLLRGLLSTLQLIVSADHCELRWMSVLAMRKIVRIRSERFRTKWTLVQRFASVPRLVFGQLHPPPKLLLANVALKLLHFKVHVAYVGGKSAARRALLLTRFADVSALVTVAMHVRTERVCVLVPQLADRALDARQSNRQMVNHMRLQIALGREALGADVAHEVLLQRMGEFVLNHDEFKGESNWNRS